ncbi:MAG: SIS domain-containing protein [Chloroflexi bacterium]|nr:SIS domain-containing protein [Chloroflexota bacterium]
MATPPAPRSAHPYHMYECIHDQPKAVRGILDSQGEAAKALAARVLAARQVHIVGIGTSWHASLVGEHLLRQVGGRDDARAWNSFEFCAYPPRLGAGDVVIVLSHRGTKQYSLKALALAKQAGALTAVVTGQDSAARVDLADVVLRTSYQDRSSAFTISNTGAMTSLAMVAVHLGGEAHAGSLRALPEQVTAALALEPQVRQWAKSVKGSGWFCFAGWGPNAATAYEVALKINEAAYPVTTAFEMEEFLHGPFVATTAGCLVTLIAPPGPGYERALEIGRAVRETGAHLAALVQEGDKDMAAVAHEVLSLPPVPEFFTPIVYLTPLYLFTYWLALELGRNPDVFRLNDPLHQAARRHYAL